MQMITQYLTTKRMKREERRERILMLAEAAAVIALIAVLVLSAAGCARAAGTEEERWVMCQPDSFLYIRSAPKKSAESTGFLELGEKVWTDGRVRNGYLHILCVTEAGDGWVRKAYLSDTEVTVGTSRAWICARGRVAVRNYPGGKRTRWMQPEDELVLFAWSEEWAVTNKGFVRIRFLEAEN